MDISIQELKQVFDRIIKKLEFEVGQNGRIELSTSIYRLIPTEQWNDFSDPVNWHSAKTIQQGDLIDDLEELKKLVSNLDRPCTYVDLDRTASILREISQIKNPV